jgi:glycosyltransferase involved in cell wall biosynthesis
MSHGIAQLAQKEADLKVIRVAHILSGSNVWGVENYVHNLLSSKNADTLSPFVICTKDGVISEKFIGSGFQVITVPMKNYYDWQAINALSELFTRQKIDLVHVHLGLDSFVGTLAARKANKPVIMSVHFDHPNYVNYNLIAQTFWSGLQKLKNKGIAHFLPITQNVAAELIRRESVPKEKITVIHPGIPLFSVETSNRAQIRHELECDEKDIVIIGIGRLAIEKNFSCLIDAIATISSSAPIKVWIIGEGSERARLNDSIVQRGLADKIRLLGYRSDVTKLLSAADIFVLPSKAEPFGMSAVEAMVAKLPVVATNGTGLGTIVDDGITGLLVPPDDAAALASAVLRLVNEPDLRLQFAAAGRKRAEQLFSSDGMTDKILGVYRDVIAAHGS